MADLLVPSSGPLRTKRNFKGLQLGAEPPSPPPPAQAPAAGGRKRPPPLAEPGPGPGPAPFDLPAESPVTGRHSAMQATLSHKLAQLELKKRIKDLGPADLKKLSDLGAGNGGSVEKVEHIPTGTIMAKKIVLIDAKSSVKKQILRELDIMHECQSEYIVSCYGSFLSDPNICICMEFADKGSFDAIYKRIGPLDPEVVGLVALSVLEGLSYLYDVHHIMHRDIKPSNILFNSQGQIKLCDFGVSGELINSVANTFVGTSVYMAPERIQGAGDGYSVRSDVWSLGISLVELALGAFPFSDPPDDDDDLSDLEGYGEGAQRTPTHRDSFIPSQKTAKRASKRKSKLTFNPDGQLSTMSIFELIHQIVQEPSPRLPTEKFSKDAVDLVDLCLLKDHEQRQTPKQLLTHPWITAVRNSDFDIQTWASIV